MAITQTQNNTPVVVQYASGSFKDDAASPALAVITLTFRPRYIRVVDETTRVEYEWFEGMAANNCLKTAAAGTRTLDTGGAIFPNPVTSVQSNADNPAETGQYYAFSIAAASIAQNDQLRWQAWA